MEVIFVFFIGVLAGLSACFLGVGGGIIIVPLLPLVFDIGQREVVGTSLLTVFLIVFLNTVFFHQRKLIQWKVVLFFGCFTSFGSYLAGLSTVFVNPILMEGVLALVICILALIFLFQPSAYGEISRWSKNQTKYEFRGNEERVEEKEQGKKGKKGRNKEEKRGVKKRKINVLLWSFCGLFLGGISGFTGVGSGAVLASLFIYFNKVAKDRVVPVVNAINMITSFFGALAFFQLKEVKTDVYLFESLKWGVIHFDIFTILALGALPTALISRSFQHQMSSRLRKKILSILLFVMGAKVFLSIFFDF